MTDNADKSDGSEFIINEMLYKSEHNPYYVWEAIAKAKILGLPFPKWVHDYLAKAAINISALANSPPKNVGDGLAKALEFRSKQAPMNPFKNAQKIRDQFRLAALVKERVDGGEMETYVIDEIVKNTGIPRSRLVRAYKEWSHLWELHLKQLDNEL